MTSILTKMLLEMIQSNQRVVRVLKGGLYLVYRPHAKDGRHRLVACRFEVWPSDVELRTLKEALQDAFDNLGNCIAYDVEVEWEKMPVKDDYAGYALHWRTGLLRETMTADTETARKLQMALNQRVQRLAKQSQEAKNKHVRVQTARKGML